jgi:hypothetical protein
VVDAAGVSGGLWLSYLFVLLYLAIAAGGVTQAAVPQCGITAPRLLRARTASVSHCAPDVLLNSRKVPAFDSELDTQISDNDVKARLRRRLPSNIFVQFLGGAPGFAERDLCFSDEPG